MSSEHPMWVTPKANVQASLGQWHQRGPAWHSYIKSLGSSRTRLQVLTIPLCHFPGSEGQGCLLSSLTPVHPASEKPAAPPWLTATAWRGLLYTDLARPPACCPPLARPTQAGPSQQVLSCELPVPTHAWPPSHPHLQAQPGPEYSFLSSSASAESVNKAT